MQTYNHCESIFISSVLLAIKLFLISRYTNVFALSFADLGTPFFPGGPELWHHPLAYATAAEIPGSALQHATLVHPALHPQVPVRSYLWLSAEKPDTIVPLSYNHHVITQIALIATVFSFFFLQFFFHIFSWPLIYARWMR